LSLRSPLWPPGCSKRHAREAFDLAGEGVHLDQIGRGLLLLRDQGEQADLQPVLDFADRGPRPTIALFPDSIVARGIGVPLSPVTACRANSSAIWVTPHPRQ
jgi:hypothetical protein